MSARIDLGVELADYTGAPPTGYDAHHQPLTDLTAQGFNTDPPPTITRVNGRQVSWGNFRPGGPALPQTTVPRCEQCRCYMPDIVGGSGIPILCSECTAAGRRQLLYPNACCPGCGRELEGVTYVGHSFRCYDCLHRAGGQ